MADVDRRGEEHEHAWAELTFINFFKFILIAWTVGVVCGCVFFAVGVYTMVYQGFLGAIWLFMVGQPVLTVFGFLMLGILGYILIKINHPHPKKKVSTVIK